MSQPIKRRQFKTNVPKFPQHQTVFDSQMNPLGLKTNKRHRVKPTSSLAELKGQIDDQSFLVDLTQDNDVQLDPTSSQEPFPVLPCLTTPSWTGINSSTGKSLAFFDAGANLFNQPTISLGNIDRNISAHDSELIQEQAIVEDPTLTPSSQPFCSWNADAFDHSSLNLDFPADILLPDETYRDVTALFTPSHSPLQVCKQVRQICQSVDDQDIPIREHLLKIERLLHCLLKSEQKNRNIQLSGAQKDIYSTCLISESMGDITEEQVSTILNEYQIQTKNTQTVMFAYSFISLVVWPVSFTITILSTEVLIFSSDHVKIDRMSFTKLVLVLLQWLSLCAVSFIIFQKRKQHSSNNIRKIKAVLVSRRMQVKSSRLATRPRESH